MATIKISGLPAGVALAGTEEIPAVQSSATVKTTVQDIVDVTIAAIVGAAPTDMDTLVEISASLGDDPAFATTMATALALKADIASPVFTGVPEAPTAAPGDNTTQISTTAFVKAAVDAAVAGLSWKQAVRAATTTDGTLATDYEAGDTIDGVVLATGDRILIKDQTTAHKNGIYVVTSSGSPTRATDADSGSELVNASVYVSEGTVNADTQWTCSTNAPITVGSTSLSFVQLTSGGGGVGDVVGPASSVDGDLVQFDGTTGKLIKGGVSLDTDVTLAANSDNRVPTQKAMRAYADMVSGAAYNPVLIEACASDETTPLSVGTSKITFRAPYAFTLTGVRASLNVAQTSGSIFTVDINESGTSVLSTKLTIDNTEKTSTTAATAAVISDSAIADDAEITIDIDQIGDGTAKGLKVYLIGNRPITSNVPVEYVLAASDETTALSTGTGKVTFRVPKAMTLTAVRASLSTAQTSGSIFTVDINESGTSLLSTKLTIDNTEKTSTTAATPAVMSDTALAEDAEISVDIDQIGDGTAKGLKITLLGYIATQSVLNDFGPSGSSHARGLVPDPGATAGTTKFLREDATWVAPVAGSKTLGVFTPMTSQSPASNFATKDTRNSIVVLDYDDTTSESSFWVGIIPEGTSLTSGITAYVHWLATTATSGSTVWEIAIENMNTDLDSDSFDTAVNSAGTANGTSGIKTVTSIAITTIDNIAAGDMFRVRLARLPSNGSDTMVGDAELISLELRAT